MLASDIIASDQNSTPSKLNVLKIFVFLCLHCIYCIIYSIYIQYVLKKCKHFLEGDNFEAAKVLKKASVNIKTKENRNFLTNEEYRLRYALVEILGLLWFIDGHIDWFLLLLKFSNQKHTNLRLNSGYPKNTDSVWRTSILLLVNLLKVFKTLTKAQDDENSVTWKRSLHYAHVWILTFQTGLVCKFCVLVTILLLLFVLDHIYLFLQDHFGKRHIGSIWNAISLLLERFRIR